MSEGKVSVEFTGKTVDLEKKIEGTDGRVDKLGNTMKKMSSDSKKAFQSLSDEIKKLGSSTHETTRKNVEVQKSFGSEISRGIGQVAQYAAGFLAVGTAISKARELFGKLEEERQAAGERNKSTEQWYAQFAQLTGGDAAKQQELIQQSQQFFAKGGAPSQEEAARSVFLMQSANVNTAENRDLMASLYPILQGNAGELSKSLAAVMQALGTKETGNMRQLLSKAVAASETNPQDVPSILMAATQTAAGAQALKWGDEDILSAIGVMAQPAGGANEAATMVTALSKALTRKDMLENKTAPEIIKEMLAWGMTSEQYGEVLGPDTSAALMQTLASLPSKHRRSAGGIKTRKYSELSLKEGLEELDQEGLSSAELEKRLGPEMVQQLLGSLQDYGQSFVGQGIEQSVRRIKEMNMTPAQEQEFLGGRKEAGLGLSLLWGSMQPGAVIEWGKVRGDVEQANTRDRVAEMLTSAGAQPEVAAAREARQAQAEHEVKMKLEGVKKNLVNKTIQNRYDETHREAPITTEIMKQWMSFVERLPEIGQQGGMPSVMERYGTLEDRAQFIETTASIRDQEMGGTGILRPEVRKKILEGLSAADFEKTQRNVESMRGIQAKSKYVPGSFQEYQAAAQEEGFAGVARVNALAEQVQAGPGPYRENIDTQGVQFGARAPGDIASRPTRVTDPEGASLLKQILDGIKSLGTQFLAGLGRAGAMEAQMYRPSPARGRAPAPILRER